MVLSFVIAPVALVSVVSGQAEAQETVMGKVEVYSSSAPAVFDSFGGYQYMTGVPNADIKIYDGGVWGSNTTGALLAEVRTDANGDYKAVINAPCHQYTGSFCVGWSFHLFAYVPGATFFGPSDTYVYVQEGGTQVALQNFTITALPTPPPAPACTPSMHVLFPGGTCCSGKSHIKKMGGPFGGSEEVCN
jgi:hypothetical protein